MTCPSWSFQVEVAADGSLWRLDGTALTPPFVDYAGARVLVTITELRPPYLPPGRPQVRVPRRLAPLGLPAPRERTDSR